MLQAPCIILKQGNCQNDPLTLEISLLQYVTTLLEYYNATCQFNNKLIVVLLKYINLSSIPYSTKF